MTDPDSPTDPKDADAPAAPPADDDAPIDAEFEEAPPEPEPEPRRKSPIWMIAGVAAVVLLIAAGFVGSWLTDGSDEADAVIAEQDTAPAPAADTRAPGPDLSAITARLDALENAPAPAAPEPAEPEVTEADLAALREQIADLRSTPPAEGAGGPDPELERRIAALEGGAPNAARTQDRLDRIEDRLAEIADTLDQAPTAQDFAAREARIDALETRAARSPAESAYRFAALREAASGGAPFEPQRAALARLRPQDADLAAMADSAMTGVPTLEELRESFPAAEIRSAAAEAPAEGGRFAWLRRMFGQVVTVRREDEDAGAQQQAVSAAEAALAAGELDEAIEATETLSGPAAEAAGYWLGRAQARARLNRRIDAIEDALAEEASQ